MTFPCFMLSPYPAVQDLVLPEVGMGVSPGCPSGRQEGLPAPCGVWGQSLVTGLPFSPNRKGALLLGRGSLGVLYGWGQGLGLAAGVLTAGPTVRRGGLLYTPTAPIPSPRLDPLRPESRGLGRGCPAPLRGMEGSCSSLPLEGPAWDTSGAVICIIFIKGWHLGGGTLPAPPPRQAGRATYLWSR